MMYLHVLKTNWQRGNRGTGDGKLCIVSYWYYKDCLVHSGSKAEIKVII